MWIVLLVAIHMATGESIVLAKQETGFSSKRCEQIAKAAEQEVQPPKGYVVIGVCLVEV